MAQDNVDIVRDSWRAFAAGGLDAVTEFWDPEKGTHEGVKFTPVPSAKELS
jgi:ketosteroid isomerase-like protein